MTISFVIALYAINFLQTIWLIGYKKYLNYRQSIILTGVIGLILFTSYFTSYSFVLLLLFLLIEAAFIFFFTKSWPLVALYSLLQNALVLISWAATVDILIILWAKNTISYEQYFALRAPIIILQQVVFFILLSLSKKVGHQQLFFISFAKIKKKYVVSSILFFVVSYSLNILRAVIILQLKLIPFIQLTVLLLALTIVFVYTMYNLSLLYAQHAQINMLSKKAYQEAETLAAANEFKHDYRNILLSLKTYIDQQQYEKASTYLASIIDYSDDFTKTDYHPQLSQIDILAVQGVIINFFEKCSTLNIPFKFMITQHISEHDLSINLIDFIRCFSIILDNALEESIGIDDPQIQLTIAKTQHSIFIEVKNTHHSTVAIEHILKNNFTTKKGHQGKGLSIFIKLLKQYPKTNYSFSKEKNLFVVRLTLPIIKQ
ncbi:hypothetical protein UAW_01773 [Enterococcus haemoperoxidus ATCC BAA-382]|uniref:Sensor histidine kinase NatK-like C-terminal domain-containing protein n=1 Tax=Enterococcus haemoperoxidus ATCC BAA-382 TaxID=1158608 RepID=R2SNP8_9ENTE|nr:GHKL domain-containing protein [Enterococcus haemoperoxidus]EOH96815.1 hypothetical protein UAW_01773 [Enterococcus haemoperoxidus ATCC BAA-382]EOT60104.1 hypothetical protein I583_02739 [Enterococcus haemoperoxidus ATCC BAA-382]OJG51770.1 hypothetical protein RV06_GL001526 [Enterococcus haemoperoxidus]